MGGVCCTHGREEKYTKHTDVIDYVHTTHNKGQ